MGTALTILVSSGLVIYGWSVLYRNAQRIASRNEIYSLVLKLDGEISSLEKEAHMFWKKHREHKTRAEATILIQRVANVKMLMRLVELRGVEIKSIYIVRLRNAITLNAEKAYSVSEEDAVEKIQIITEYASEIRSKAYESFLSSYPHASP